MQVVDRSGRIVARSSALGGRVLPVAARCAIASRVLADGRLGTDPMRVYTAPLGELGAGEAAGGAVIVAVRPGRDRAHAGPDADADRGLRAGRRRARGRAGDAAHPPRAAAADPALGRRAGDRALRRRLAAAAGSRRYTTRSASWPGTLNAMLASLERAQEAEHRFVGDASHELRTPLTALRGNAAYLAKHGPDPAVDRRHPGRRGRGSASCSTTCWRSPARTPPRRCRASRSGSRTSPTTS